MQQPTTTKREVTVSMLDYVDDNNCKMGGGDTLIYIHNEKISLFVLQFQKLAVSLQRLMAKIRCVTARKYITR